MKYITRIKRGLIFFVQRNSWKNTTAEVIGIEGVIEGKPPYYKSQKVYADFYNKTTKKIIDKNEEISSPGTYAYRMIGIRGGRKKK
ncbi:hypothetical protein [Tenacibaculum sp.]|uniref:hypothetical protein n=1 Tax=Tenacibaculum sp. TaxID=1906242 RepID=UPI003AA91A1B